jgi:hypothetical protein
MPTLRVVRTGNRRAFDIIAGAHDYQTRHSASAVYVHYRNVVEEARLKTYANDPKPFGPTLRHCHNISEGIIDRFNLIEGQELQCDFVQQNGEHHYIIR